MPSEARFIHGTAGWSYKDWVGPFYSEGTPSSRYLEHYAASFPGVEVDSTYYRTPSERAVAAWEQTTPEGFVFSPKMVGTVTHDKFLVDCAEDARRHLGVLSNLGTKLGPVILQFPYFNKARGVTLGGFLERLKPFLDDLPEGFRLGVEIRNKAFLKAPLLEALRERGVALVLVDHVWMPAPRELVRIDGLFTADFVPIRLVGDRHGIEKITKAWGEVVIDQRARVREWADLIDTALSGKLDVNAFANNHYAGHGPATARQLVELVERRRDA